LVFFTRKKRGGGRAGPAFAGFFCLACPAFGFFILLKKEGDSKCVEKAGGIKINKSLCQAKPCLGGRAK